MVSGWYGKDWVSRWMARRWPAEGQASGRAPVVRPDASIGAQNRASWGMASRWEGERAGLSGRDGEGGADDQHHPHPHQLVSLMPPSLLPHHDMDDVHA